MSSESEPLLFLASFINGSSTTKLVVSISVVVPFTVKFPETVTLPAKVALAWLPVKNVVAFDLMTWKCNEIL